MNIFIWEKLQVCSDRYHPEGGLLVIAATLERARELAVADFSKTSAVSEEPDHVWGTFAMNEEKVITFPDAGCC
jgi:hypothetical protein